MADELKPCPLCGGKPYVEREGDARKSHIIVCEDCGLWCEANEEGRWRGNKWNTRAALAAPVPTDAALRDQLAERDERVKVATMAAQLTVANSDLRRTEEMLCACAQILDGWSGDECFSKYDAEVRQRICDYNIEKMKRAALTPANQSDAGTQPTPLPTPETLTTSPATNDNRAAAEEVRERAIKRAQTAVDLADYRGKDGYTSALLVRGAIVDAIRDMPLPVTTPSTREGANVGTHYTDGSISYSFTPNTPAPDAGKGVQGG